MKKLIIKVIKSIFKPNFKPGISDSNIYGPSISSSFSIMERSMLGGF